MKAKTKKKIAIAVAAAVIIIAAILLIAALRPDVYGYNWFDRNKTIADTGAGTVKFSQYKQQFIQNYNTNFSSYAQYGIMPTDEQIANLREQTKKNCALQYLFIEKAEELGLELTEEQAAAVATAGQNAYESLAEEVKNEMKEAYGQEPTASQLEDQLCATFNNMGMSKTTYKKDAEFSMKANYCALNVSNYYNENEIYSDEELRAQYDLFVEENFSNYTAGDYKVFETAYQNGSTTYRYLMIPEDFVFVRTIKVETLEEKDAIVAAIEGGEDFETNLIKAVNKDEFIKTMDPTEGYAIGKGDSFMEDNDLIYNKAVEMEIGAWDWVDVVKNSTDSEGNATETHTYYIFMRVEGQTGKVPYEKYADRIKSGLVGLMLDAELLKNTTFTNENLLLDFENVLFGTDD